VTDSHEHCPCIAQWHAMLNDVDASPAAMVWQENGELIAANRRLSDQLRQTTEERDAALSQIKHWRYLKQYYHRMYEAERRARRPPEGAGEG
jgi:hypothetical protein